VLLCGAGLVLLAATTDLVSGSVFGLVWPLALIVVGGWFMLGRWRPGLTGGFAEDEVDVTAMLSGRKVVSRSRRFRGGKLAVLFGGIELDLRGASLAPEARLDISAVFGGVDILVPPGWRVRMNGPVVLGGYENHAEREAPPLDDASCLDVRLQVLLGGAAVKVGPPVTAPAA
jgi:Cell wall-active antibiotics response 4TMS YvqF